MITNDLLERLKNIVGEDHILTSLEEREYFSMDAFWNGAVVAAVVQPGSTEEMAKTVKIATEAGYAVIPRGGGMSYTSGYVPERDKSITIDTGRLDKIIEINETDMYITAQCGCTWKQLYEVLKEKDLRMPYFGPLSGIRATVGGTLSNNSMFFGSGVYGCVADNVLALSVVLADGRILKTGTRSNRGQNPFSRYFGPDLTGIFLSDAGALGIKAEASFRLMGNPEAVGFASFAYDSFDEMFEAQAEIARQRLAAECFGMDPFLNRKSKLKSPKEAVKTVKDVALAGSSLKQGIKDVVGMAAGGTRFLDSVAYSLHITVEGVDKSTMENLLARVRKIACKKGKEIANTIPKVVRATPFRPVGEFLVGQEGERWVPIHAFLPLSKGKDVSKATKEYFAGKKTVLEKYSIQTSQLTAISGTDLIFEPAFYYPDKLKPFHLKNLEPADAKRYAAHPAVPGANEAVIEMLRDLSGIFKELGAAHHQIGKFYPYKAALAPESWSLLEGIKHLLDPHALMNPGALGLH